MDNRYGHSFRMNAMDQTNKTISKCELDGNNSRGYTNRYRAQTTVANDGVLLVDGNVYYCGHKIRDGSVILILLN